MPTRTYRVAELLAFKPEEQEPYLKGLLYAGQTAILHGPPEVGKSYLLALMGLLLAAGADWHGVLTARKPQQVLYVQTEGTVYDPAERLGGYGEYIYKAGERLLWCFPRGLDLAKGKGVGNLREVMEQQATQVVMFDTLSSVMSGSVNNDEVVGAVEDSVWDLKQQFPSLAVVFAHHDHRDRYFEGQRVNEQADAIAGSYKIRAMADQVWHYRRAEGAEWPVFTQTKGRSRFHRLDAFEVRLDEETGMMVPMFASDGKWAFRQALEREGGMSSGGIAAWATAHGRKAGVLARWRAELIHEGIARDDAGGLRWCARGDSLGNAPTVAPSG